MADDRRHSRRYPLSLALTVRRGDTGQDLEGRSRDISSCGIYFLVPREIPSGCPIDFTVSLVQEDIGQPGSFVTARGCVVRVETSPPEDDGSSVGVAAVIDSYEIIRAAQLTC